MDIIMKLLDKKTARKFAGMVTLGLLSAFATGCVEMSTSYTQDANGNWIPQTNYRRINGNEVANVANSAVNMGRVLDGKRPVPMWPVPSDGPVVTPVLIDGGPFPQPLPVGNGTTPPRPALNGRDSEEIRKYYGERGLPIPSR